VGEIKPLTGLRFIAAFYVFIFHLQIRELLPPIGWRLDNIIAQGALGVNVFFVLSGLVLAYSHMQPHKIPKQVFPFLLKRLVRLGPVYMVGLLGATLVTIYLHNYPPHFWPIVLLDLTFLNAWVPTYAMQWYGGGGWSISCEMFFYLTFPFLLPRLLGLSQRGLVTALIAAIVLGSLPGLWHSTHPALKLFNWVYSYPLARLPEFVVGICLTVLVFKHGWVPARWATLAAVGVLVVYLAFFGGKIAGFVGHNLVLLPVLVVLLAGLCRQPPRLLQWLGSKAMTYLGRISYGFYIWQLVLLLFVDSLLESKQLPLHHTLTALALLAASFGLAVLSYHLIEKPIHRVLSTRLSPKPSVLV
jgi:peptidoglycan/LPS O-acetylase OafA/YrhL